MESFGTVFEQRSDHAAADSYFQMESHYFLCKLNNNETAAQKLIGYEMEEGYTPVWVSIQEAIASNESVFEKDESHIFIVRENFVQSKINSTNFLSHIENKSAPSKEAALLF